MGSAGSKAAQKGARKFPTRASGAAPPPHMRSSRAPQETAAAPPPRHPQASYSKDEAIRADAGDPQSPELISPDFSARLRQMGVVQPNPTFSPSSTASSSPSSYSSPQPSRGPSPSSSHSGSSPPAPSPVVVPAYPSPVNNATLGVLEARRRLQEQAEREFNELGRRHAGGREFLDIGTIRNVVALRQRGEAAGEIEARFRLKPGVVARLGSTGVVSNAAEAAS